MPLASAGDWAEFRGPTGGVATDSPLPTDWAPDKKIQWKTEIPGYGWSQPIIVGDKVFVTTAITENQQRPQVGGFGGRGGGPGGPGFPPGGPGGFPPGKGKGPPTGKGPPGPDQAKAGPGERGGPGGFGGRGGFGNSGRPNVVYQWKVFCLDRGTGKVLWEQLAYEGKPTIGVQPSNTYASQTPVADGRRVYAYFGMTGIFCFDMDGKPVWSKNLGSYQVSFGPGSSPALDSERVFVQCDNEEQSFLVALDKQTGDEVWRVERDEGSNYATPYVWKNNARTELVTCGSKVRSYDPATGKLLWEYGNFGAAVKPSPVGDAERLYVCTAGGGFGPRGGKGPPGRPDAPGGAQPPPPGGFGGLGGGRAPNSPLVAIKAGASGDISLSGTETSNAGVAWSISPGGGGMASPLVYRGCVYVLQQNGGIIGCYDALTGTQHYRQRLDGAAEFWSSPWAADGKVYCLDSDGQTFVVEAGPELKVLAINKLDDIFRSSVALAPRQILFRGVDRLYSVAE
jgi:outer membrane protein assembly factor BamB